MSAATAAAPSAEDAARESTSARASSDRLLRVIARGIAPQSGEAFFRALVRGITEALGVAQAFAVELIDGGVRARSLAYWDGQRFLRDFEYVVEGTVCEVVLGGQTCHYPQGIRELYPDDAVLARHRIESYLAMPLIGPDGAVLGHLAVLHDRPLPVDPAVLSVFEIFTARAATELLRMRAERAMRASEERLSSILASALDAIVHVDARRYVTLFNPAAESIFRCAAGWAIGQPFDRFLSRRFRALLERQMAALRAGEEEGGKLWAPEGLTAMRADGEEFPVEMTLSPVQVHGDWFVTVILRDVKDRVRFERRLKALKRENRVLREEVEAELRFGALIGDSPAMLGVFADIDKVAPVDSTVLLLGETGTGKELIARTLHQGSARRERLLIKVNCAALPSELIESELFGHEKGAFTGATAQRKGRFELANGGTLFLDEVGELSPAAQAKLLRVLQEQEFERVGGTEPIRVDVRLVAATNRDLEAMVAEGTFRADLYYRLNVFPIRVPSLRERREDIPLLVGHFVARLSRRLGKRLDAVSEASMRRLVDDPWPGNVREMQNVLERAAILSPGPLVEVETGAVARALPAPEPAGTLEDVGRRYIEQVLAETRGVIEGPGGAAARLGMKPSTLRFRMRKLGVERPAAR